MAKTVSSSSELRFGMVAPIGVNPVWLWPKERRFPAKEESMPEPTNATETNVAATADLVRDNKRHVQRDAERLQRNAGHPQVGDRSACGPSAPGHGRPQVGHGAAPDPLRTFGKAEETRISNPSKDLAELKEFVEELKKRQDSHSSKIAVGEWIGRNLWGIIIKVIGAAAVAGTTAAVAWLVWS